MSDKDENERENAPEAEAEGLESGRDPQDLPEGAAEGDGGEPGDIDMGSDTLAVTSMLGPERWVQFGFIALAFVTFFVADKLVFEVWRRFAQPDPMVTGAASAILGMVVAFYAYTNPTSRKLADEVVAELGQVSWPSRDETYVSTVVVVLTSVVAAVYTGLFDALWSAVTDFVYTV
jgi:preprotein translocase SecE subunit